MSEKRTNKNKATPMSTNRRNIPPSTVTIKVFKDFLKAQFIEKNPKINIIKLTK